MTWTLSDSLDEYRAQAGEFLAAHPAENTVLLTIVDRLAVGAPAGGDPRRPPHFGWWRRSAAGPVEAAFVHTPPQPVRLSRMPQEAAAELAAVLADRGLGGVAGAVRAAEAFAAVWASREPVAVQREHSLRLYRLGELTPPSAGGRIRPAAPAERELLLTWYQEFVEEARAEVVDVGAVVDRRLADGDLHVWEDEGRPVSLAALSPVLAGMARIGPVYTPPEHRGRGYGSAVTAGVSAVALDRGAGEVLLYTDLGNPVSNSIYQKIGYRPVEDTVVLEFAG